MQRWACLALLMLAGCAGPADPAPPPQASEDANAHSAQDLYERLAGQVWCQKPGAGFEPLPPSRRTYEFHADGTYEWVQFSDYTEDGGEGSWNLKKTSRAGGVLDLGDSVLRFAFLQDGRLWLLGWGALDACEPVASPAYRQVLDLPTPPRPRLFSDLTATAWRKSYELDLHRLPTRLVFRVDGSYRAEFRGGECVYEDSWSLERAVLVRQVPIEDCDGRTSPDSPVSIRHEASMSEGFASLEGNWYEGEGFPPAANRRGNPGGCYGNAVCEFTYDGTWASGKMTNLTFRLENLAAPRPAWDWDPTLVFDHLNVTLEPTDGGASKLLASHDLQGLRLEPGRNETIRLEITPEGSGAFYLRFESTVGDGYQSWGTSKSYWLEL